MLISSLYFLEGSTNIFHLRFRMITHTLFDVAAINGLQPNRDTLDLTRISKLKSNPTFLLLVLDLAIISNNVMSFMRKSLMSTILYALFGYPILYFVVVINNHKLIALATQIIEGKNLCLRKLILGSLYEYLGIFVCLKSIIQPDDNLLISGPMWRLQLWLNATFDLL